MTAFQRRISEAKKQPSGKVISKPFWAGKLRGIPALRGLSADATNYRCRINWDNPPDTLATCTVLNSHGKAQVVVLYEVEGTNELVISEETLEMNL